MDATIGELCDAVKTNLKVFMKPRIYFSQTAKCWKVAHMNRAGNEWRAYLAAFNFCHKLNVRMMERK
jgi:hypothetical protein